MEYVLIKLSGKVLAEPEQIAEVAVYIREAQAKGQGVVLVHGGGIQLNALSKRLSVEVTQIEGRRVTDEAAMEVLQYAVAGKLNSDLVAALRSVGIKAVGMTGADGGLTESRRREPLIINDEPVDFGLVGEIETVDPKLLSTVLEAGFVPVVACMTWNAGHGLLNINADTVAFELASALQANELVLLSDVSYVLGAHREEIGYMDHTMFLNGKQAGWIAGGMIPKLFTAFKALERGVGAVRITNPTGLKAGKGTVLVTGEVQ